VTAVDVPARVARALPSRPLVVRPTLEVAEADISVACYFVRDHTAYGCITVGIPDGNLFVTARQEIHETASRVLECPDDHAGGRLAGVCVGCRPGPGDQSGREAYGRDELVDAGPHAGRSTGLAGSVAEQ
jgi:hypothetical protein